MTQETQSFLKVTERNSEMAKSPSTDYFEKDMKALANVFASGAENIEPAIDYILGSFADACATLPTSSNWQRHDGFQAFSQLPTPALSPFNAEEAARHNLDDLVNSALESLPQKLERTASFPSLPLVPRLDTLAKSIQRQNLQRRASCQVDKFQSSSMDYTTQPATLSGLVFHDYSSDSNSLKSTSRSRSMTAPMPLSVYSPDYANVVPSTALGHSADLANCFSQNLPPLQYNPPQPPYTDNAQQVSFGQPPPVSFNNSNNSFNSTMPYTASPQIPYSASPQMAFAASPQLAYSASPLTAFADIPQVTFANSPPYLTKSPPSSVPPTKEPSKKEKKHVCPNNCGKSFAIPSALKRHKCTKAAVGLIPKSGTEKYTCGQCPMSFSRTHDLKRHEFSHCDIKPFTCERCGRGFARKDALKRHEERMKTGKKVMCTPIAKFEFML